MAEARPRRGSLACSFHCTNRPPSAAEPSFTPRRLHSSIEAISVPSSLRASFAPLDIARRAGIPATPALCHVETPGENTCTEDRELPDRQCRVFPRNSGAGKPQDDGCAAAYYNEAERPRSAPPVLTNARQDAPVPPSPSSNDSQHSYSRSNYHRAPVNLTPRAAVPGRSAATLGSATAKANCGSRRARCLVGWGLAVAVLLSAAAVIGGLYGSYAVKCAAAASGAAMHTTTHVAAGSIASATIDCYIQACDVAVAPATAGGMDMVIVEVAADTTEWVDLAEVVITETDVAEAAGAFANLSALAVSVRVPQWRSARCATTIIAASPHAASSIASRSR